MDILQDFDLLNYNTFALKSKAKQYIRITNQDELTSLNITPQERTIVLGGGSNCVFINDYLNATVLHISNKGINIIDQSDKDIIIEACSGENWGDFVEFCSKNNYSGIENLAAIPGNVGASPVQNIGAYGMEMKECFEQCLVYNINKREWKWYSKEECKFDYRYSIFKYQRELNIIWKVRFRLNKTFTPNLSYSALSNQIKENNITISSPLDVCKLVTQIRNSKLPNPKELGNAGSFFKNPIISKEHFEQLKTSYPDIPHYDSNEGVKIAAGWLIEQTGWRGKIVGNVGMHKKQALVMVNYSGAKGEEIILLAEQIKKSIKEKFEIDLEIEAHLIY